MIRIILSKIRTALTPAPKKRVNLSRRAERLHNRLGDLPAIYREVPLDRVAARAGDLGLTAEPDAVSVIELGLDTADSSQIAPFWAALLTGDADARGRGTPGDEIRDATGRSPNLWFGDAPEASGQRFHLEVYVPRSVAAARLAAALAAGGTIVDDSESPGLTVLADSQGNLAVLCVAEPALPED